jgi:hypothetical protein
MKVKAPHGEQDGPSVQLNQIFVDSFSVWPKPYERHALWLALVLPRGFLSRKEIRPELQKGCYRSVFSFLSARCFKVRIPLFANFAVRNNAEGAQHF